MEKVPIIQCRSEGPEIEEEICMPRSTLTSDSTTSSRVRPNTISQQEQTVEQELLSGK